MSGGSHDYGCYTLERLYSKQMKDDEMNDMINDLIRVLHDLEWWQSGDIGEDEYRRTVEKFKTRWLGNRDEDLRDRLSRSLHQLQIEVMDR